jgi:L-2-hydroxyglutarate oxidase LhgO
MKYQFIIIGAGVVGLAIAAELSKKHKDILLIEKWGHFGEETSSRNSEVVHAGIYYPKDSLKAKLCVAGNQSIYEYCNKYSIPFNNCGKLIVASSNDDFEKLESIFNNANELGARDLSILNKNQIQKLENNLKVESAILSPSSGIVDSHSLMQTLEAEAINNGVDIIYNHNVIEIIKGHDWQVKVTDEEHSEFEIESEFVINSAGLHSDKIAEMVGMDIDDLGYRLHYAKGHYFKLNPSKNSLVNRLIYPIPAKNTTGLGIHVTLDMGGGIKLGPDVRYLSENIMDYAFDDNLKERFFEAVNSYLDNFSVDDLNPDYVGIRPKIQRQGEAQKDFIIKNESDNGFPNLINLIGIESPGLTCSLEIAKMVKGLI